MDENSCVLLPLTTQLKKAEHLECVLCPGTPSPLPAKWCQYLKSSSKVMLQAITGVRAVRKILHWPPGPYFVSFPITYYQGQHIVTAEGRTQGCGETQSMPVSAAAFGQAGRDVLSCPLLLGLAWKQRAVSRLPWKGDTMPSCAQLPLLPSASGMDSSPAGEHAGNLCP